MNRRSFFRALAQGAITAAAPLYAPWLLEDSGPRHMTFDWDKGMQIPSTARLVQKYRKHIHELAIYGKTTINGKLFRMEWPIVDDVYGVSPAMDALGDVRRLAES